MFARLLKARSCSVVTTTSVLFSVLAIGLLASLAMPLDAAWRELAVARRAGALAHADRVLFEATNKVRLSRGDSQALLQTVDDPRAALEQTRAETAGILRDVARTVAPVLPADERGRLAGIGQAWEQVTPHFQQEILALAGRQRAERNLKDTFPWYNAVGVVVNQLSEVSRSIAAAARMSDPVIGELVMVRQYAWSIRQHLGNECSMTREQFSLGQPLSPALRQKVVAERAGVQQGLDDLDELLAGAGSAPSVRAAVQGARTGIADNLKFRDASYASLGGANATSPGDWLTGCNAPYGAALQPAFAALDAIARYAAARTRAAGIMLGLAGAGALLAAVIAAASIVMVRRRIARPLSTLSGAIARLAARDYATPVPALARNDEFGAMATTLETLRHGAAEAERLEAEQEAARAAREARAARVAALVQGFETEIGGMVGHLSASATELEATAQSMTGLAVRANGQAASVSAAAEQASAGVQTVAAASDELVGLDRRDQPAGLAVHRDDRQVRRRGQAHRRDRAQPRRERAADRPGGGADHRHCRADQPAGAQRDHRGGARRRGRQGLRRGCLRGEGAGDADREGDGGDRAADRRDPGGDRRGGGGDPGHLGLDRRGERHRGLDRLGGGGAGCGDLGDRAERAADRPGDAGGDGRTSGA